MSSVRESAAANGVASDDTVRDWLVIATNYAAGVIDWLALIMIVVGAVEAFFRGFWTMFATPDGHAERNVWLRLGRCPRT